MHAVLVMRHIEVQLLEELLKPAHTKTLDTIQINAKNSQLHGGNAELPSPS
jgi:hypothetical protein